MTLASGPLNASDVLAVELHQSIEAPPAVLVWPGAPSVCDPRRFPAAALAVIAIMDEAIIALKAAVI